MKRLLAIVFCTLAFVASFGLAYADDPIAISAKGVCVMDADTGKVIISRNADLRLPPASCTKVMTAIITLERAKMTDTFRVSPRAATMSPSKVYLKPGDQVTVEALLYSLL
jgi:D-alanyl-D-alanine carboxypeptidase